MVILNIQKLMCTKERVNCRGEWLYQKVNSQLVETVTYIFTDIPFLDNHSLYFFIKNGFKLLREKRWKLYLNMEELKQKVGLRTAKRIITFEIASQFKQCLSYTSK